VKQSLGVWINTVIETVSDQLRDEFTPEQRADFLTIPKEENPDLRAGYLMGYHDALTELRKNIPNGVLRDVRIEIPKPQ
jgi:hypothetical protein